MDDAKSKDSDVGVTTKTGQYLEEPARLIWTTQKPTTPRLYGYRHSRDMKAYVVEVELDGDRGPIVTIEGEWAGPLLPPK